MRILQPRRLAGALSLGAAVTLVVATPSVGLARSEPGATGDRGVELHAAPGLLDGPARGERAIRELGDQLAVAAARNDLRASELRSLLRSDRTAWVDEGGRIYFVEPTRTEARPASTAPAAVAPLAQTFLLHSNPDAPLKIFLDVDGADVSGTAWNSSKGVTSGQHPAWDPGGNGAAFSDSEKLQVQQVWAIVAEDYAPFGVDVTTEDPGYDGLVRSGYSDTTYGTRVLVSPSTDAHTKICGGGCGGVAYIDVFDELGTYYQPAWVFPQALANDAKNVAEAASHEAGHNLGLKHDGSTTSTYYAGQGSWAPIMGVGYYEPIVQWSRGSYPNADNSTQDDVAAIASYLGRRTDEAPGPSGIPAALPTGSAVITDASDVDTYLLGSCTSGSVVTVAPAAFAPNLDVQATLRDATGTVVATAAPVSGNGDGTTASGMGASITLPATAPGWTLSVDGAGEGSWAANGYDDYGSLGSYTVSAPGCGGLLDVGVPPTPIPDPPSGPSAAPTTTLGTTAVTAPQRMITPAVRVKGRKAVVRWTAALSPASPVTTYLVDLSKGTDRSAAGTARKLVIARLKPGKYRLRIAAVNAHGQSPFSGWVRIRVR